jgi:hypothetical protein
MDFSPSVREIIEEFCFKECLTELRIEYQRLDEAMGGVCFALARHPEMFPSVLGTHISRLRLQSCLGVPESDIWFAYDNKYVRLIHFEVLPE